MHTPEQAKELWCPMSRTKYTNENRVSGSIATAACNITDIRVPSSCRCIADKCAMWRWVTNDTMERGYCGLAPVHGVAA